MEELMVDLMYQLPEEPENGKYTITPDVIKGKTDLFKKSKKESA